MRKSMVVGNWKMNGSQADNGSLLAELLAAEWFDGVDVAVCPPFPYLYQVEQLLSESHIGLGAQNVSAEPGGAFTGEVSATMLADLACRYVIVGHSERRALYSESSALVAKKFARVQQANMTPILCLGETLQQREADETFSVLSEQLLAVIGELGVSALRASVVAYEPVWAIGTGKTATPEQAQEVHGFLRKLIVQESSSVGGDIRILYGGSVKASNAAQLFAMEDIDGALVGGASLKAREFASIAQAASN